MLSGIRTRVNVFMSKLQLATKRNRASQEFEQL